MQIIPLYKYEREDGGTTVSPIKPENTEYTEMYRLVADEGKILTNGERQTSCADVESVDGWEEIDNPEEEATEQDYLSAFAELGVETNEETNS
jgi:hypothetical protein